MDTKTKQTIAASLKAYMATKKLSLKQVEAESGIGYGSISNVINEKFEIVSDSLLRQVAAFLKLDGWQIMETTNLSIVQELAWEAQEYSRFFGIIANSGFGKTGAFEYYKRKNPNCFYMLADMLMGGKKQFLMAVQRAMGISKGANPTDMLDAIAERLNSLDKPLLIIDDAGKLNDTNLRILQLIYDRTERSAGIIISGTPYLKEMLEKGVTRNRMGFDELYRRVEHWQRLNPPLRQEVVQMCHHYGLTDKEVVNFIVNTGKNFGYVRSNITRALRLKDKNKLSEANLQSLTIQEVQS